MVNYINKLTGCLAMLLTICCVTIAGTKSIVPETNGIRRIVKASIDNKEMLYISEIDGAVSLNDTDGNQLWRNPSDNPALMFEIIAKDINGDNNDDILGVSGNGSVYAWSSNGDLLWKFNTDNKVRLCQIAVIGEGLNTRIFTGGNDYNLYELNSKGELLSTTPIDGSVLYIESGDFIKDGKEDLFLFTMSHDKLRSKFLGFIDSDTKRVIKEGSILDIYKGNNDNSLDNRLTPATSLIVNKVMVDDIDSDGKDDVLITGHADCGYTYVVNGNLETIASCIGERKDGQIYAHAVAMSLKGVKNQIVMQYGGILRVFDLKGNKIAASGERFKGVIFNEFVVVPSKNLLIGAGQIGGDNTLYCYDLTKEDWYNTVHTFNGRQKEVEENIDMLYSQALSFKRPSYQPKQENEFVIAGVKKDQISDEVNALTEGEIVYLTEGGGFSENTSRDHMVKAIGEIALNHDPRRRYVNSREEIVEAIRKKEEAGEPFQIWVGHGHDPFFIQIETLEQMIAAAPTTLRGLVYAEMANTSDPRIGYFVDEYMPRIAKAIRDNKAKTKIYFRYKNMFWAADCHEPIWKELFFSGKYSDIIAPAAEDTNNRLQDLNFVGRVGMWMSGYIDDFTIRIINDNPTSWRPYSPGGQRSVSPYLRNAALMTAYGARHGLFGISYLDKSGFSPFFALIKSGLIPALKPDDILSVGSWFLVKDIDQVYLDRVNDGHDLLRYEIDDDEAVISCAGVQWCGADVPSHDYSNIACGVNYRWLNFIPPMPNGMVPITSSEYSKVLDKEGANYVTSDINHGFIEGKKVSGKEFGPTMKSVVEDGAKKLLMTVDGASWSLFKVGDNHARLLLVDPGYIDPQERVVKIKLQNTMPLSAIDILSGEEFSVKNGELIVRVPAGSMRFIDFEYEQNL